MLKHKIKEFGNHFNKKIHPHTKKGLGFIKSNKKEIVIGLIAFFFIFSGVIALWISTFQMPDLESFDTRKITQSTKIYDRTGKILLYDIHENTKRIVVPFDSISIYIKNATVAIEDNTFYEHGGIKLSSFFRAVLANLFSGSFSQGGSTITQQVIKNSLLTTEKKISRKLKEWFLSIQLEKTMTKDEILAIYLNGNPYGGTVYGVEEACETFFGKKATDVTLAEAAYIAAIPKAPTYYSPYGQNKKKLDDRQKLVLAKMLEYKFISKEEYDSAIKEQVNFLPQQKYGIEAPHFVEFIKQYLIDKYGEDAIKEKGFKVITTLNYDLQQKAEEIVKRRALENTENFNASNAAVVVIDPKTGQILSMVGSRDYFDKTIDGNYNVTLAYRQPGSTFKPFVYATAFNKGYTPDTVIFDTPTEFQTTCNPDGTPINPDAIISSSTACYMPEDYDGEYLGPISLRNALAQSRNVPAVKMLYLVGIKNAIETAKSMGVKNLTNPEQYGLTLVIGGGEVSLLDMTSAYGVFANDGVRNPYTGILSIEDLTGNVLESYTQKSQDVLSPNTAENISDVLSDVAAKIPAYGANSPLFFNDKKVATKTGTTNNYKDVWTIGYTPEIVVGAWAGNNDNTPMVKKVAGTILAPLWHEVMEAALASTTGEIFKTPQKVTSDTKPILRGFWQGNETYFIDSISGKLATDMTPEQTKKEVSVQNIHSILYYVDKNDPLGPAPEDPYSDSQFNSWEYSVQKWLEKNPQIQTIKPTSYDDIHTLASKPEITILSPLNNFEYSKDSRINIIFSAKSKYSILKADFYLNDELIGTSLTQPFVFNFIPSSLDNFEIGLNKIKITVYDGIYNKSSIETTIKIKN